MLTWERATEGTAANALKSPHQPGMGELGVRVLTLEAGPKVLPFLPLCLDLHHAASVSDDLPTLASMHCALISVLAYGGFSWMPAI